MAINRNKSICLFVPFNDTKQGEQKMPVLVTEVNDTKHIGFTGCPAAIAVDTRDVAYMLDILRAYAETPVGEVFLLSCAKKSFFACSSDDLIEKISELLGADGCIAFNIVDHIPRGPKVASTENTTEVSFFCGSPFTEDYCEIIIVVPGGNKAVEYKTIEHINGHQCNNRWHGSNAWNACMTACMGNKQRARTMLWWLRAATRRAIKLAKEVSVA